ncbi:MAG: serine hydrolase [Bacteroidota bacterium]
MSLLLMICLAFAGCDDAAIEDKTVRNPVDPRIARAAAYADALVSQMSLAEKAGQLLLIEVPATTDSTQLAALAQMIRQQQPGGIFLPQADRFVQAEIAYRCQQASPGPLWVAFDADHRSGSPPPFPKLRSLGATRSDSLAQRWGSALGREGRSLGAHLCFTSAVKVAPSGVLLANALGSDPDHIRPQSAAALRGIAESGIVPCLRPLPTADELPPDTAGHALISHHSAKQLLAHELAPLHDALAGQAPLLQHTLTTFAQLDSLPAAFSAFTTQTMLREGLRYEDVLFAPEFPQAEAVPGAAELRALCAGADMLLRPAAPLQIQQAIVQAVETGELSEAQLDEKVSRVLYRKALSGLDTLAVQQPDSTQLSGLAPREKALEWEITTAALTLLRDTESQIPLRHNAEEMKIATLAIGAKRRSPMQRAMEVHAPMDHYLLRENASEKACRSRLARLKRYDWVIVGLHAPLTQRVDTLPAPVRDLLADLESETRLVVAHFGEAKVLGELDTLTTVLTGYEDRPLTQKAAGQFLWGGVMGNGRLPTKVGSDLCAGDGLQRDRLLRLSYVEPEVVGANPVFLAAVDSILNHAIWQGTFPGCQVLAAKNGQVFLHKAYGHHDYTRTRRVRLDDVYDIASVTKIVATTLLAMQAYEEDTLHLNLPLKHYFPELDSNFITIRDVTPRELMLHQAGLPPGLGKLAYGYYTMVDSVDSLRNQFYAPQPDDSLFTVEVTDHLYFNQHYLDTIWHRLRTIRVDTNQGYKYSDVSMFLMKALLERIYERGMDTLLRRDYYLPMGLQTVGYHPLDRFDREKVAPTEDDRWWRKQQLQGHVHDHTTALFGGVGGAAGLFSDARDLAIIMQMLLNGGTYGGKRYFRASTVRKFVSRQAGSRRGLGFDMQRPVPQLDRGYCCISASPRTFGHFGFTGTCTWADPENDIVYVLLTNRVYPRARNGKINRLRVRQSVQEAIYASLGLSAAQCVVADSSAADSLRGISADSTLIAAQP